MPHIEQMPLVIAITKEIEAQGVEGLIPRHVNACIAGANLIVAELAREAVSFDDGCGLQAWLCSDETGLSSGFMAYVLLGGPPAQNHHPHDPADFERCLGLIRACPEARDRLPDMRMHSFAWDRLVDRWDEIGDMLANGDRESAYEAIKECVNP